MQEETELVRRIVERDLLGPETLLREEEPPAPRGYELVRALGRGGGGVVYLARELELDRPVAIKFLADAGAAELERFRREARFTAQLNDPSIVQVYELGEVTGRPYISMQYIDGANLAHADLSTEELVRVAREVALALKHAHSQGIVHRDIKPENILLDRQRRAYVTDFGIARNLRADRGDTISSAGQIMGTPGLMPPEQARGEIEAVDARSDVYTLGGTLYFKLTGGYPFEGDNVVDILHAVIHDLPRLPRARVASIPRGLEAIVMRCLQKAREDRYQSMADFVADLERFREGGRVQSESSAWFRKLVGKLVGVPAREPEVREEPDPYWTVGMEIVREISAWDGELYRVSGSLERSFARLDGIRERLEAILSERPDTAWARFYRGVVLFRRGRLREALEDMECSLNRMHNQAGAYFELGRLYLALHLKEHQAARKHITRTGVDQELRSARGHVDQAVLIFEEARRLSDELPAWQSEYAEAVARLAESDFAACVDVCDRILADEPDLEDVWKLRGDAQRFAGEEPFESYERALEIRRSHYDALYAMAEAHLARSRFDEARQALARARRIYPDFHAAGALTARSWLLEAAEGGDAELLEEAERAARAVVDAKPESYDALVTLAEIHLERGSRSGSGDEPLAGAIAALDRAATLSGCQNRVNLLRARAQLERARRARERGVDPEPHLAAGLALCSEAGELVAESNPWDEMRAEFERERARSD